MKVRRRRDVGPRVVEVAWNNGDRHYGYDPVWRLLFRAYFKRVRRRRRLW